MKPSSLPGLLLKGRSGDVRIQLFRYLVSGGTAFIVDAGLLALLTELFGEEKLLLWTAIAFSAGLLITYLFSILWVFDNRSMKNRAAERSKALRRSVFTEYSRESIFPQSRSGLR